MRGATSVPSTHRPPHASAVASAPAEVPAAAPADAASHFASLLRYETDCWDVHHALDGGADDFLLVDVRGRGGWDAGHIPGAVHIPHADLTAERLADVGPDRLVVVYCAGPHCNGADRAALRLARLGRPVKKMIGGITGWLDEGFDLVSDTERGAST